jgi:hypothetical protein
MLTSHCQNCGNAKSDYVAVRCAECQTAHDARYDEHRKANPEAPESDALYAAREALHERAMSRAKNLVDPRLHSRFNGGQKFIAGR